MKFFATLFSIAALATYAQAVSTTFDPIYDNKNEPMTAVACSTGSNGMITKGFTKFGQLPTFPNIGGAPAISGFNDPDCGSCWNLTYTNNGKSQSVVITAIDASSPNFNIAEAAMNTLTGGQAVEIGTAPVTAVRLANSACGL